MATRSAPLAEEESGLDSIISLHESSNKYHDGKSVPPRNVLSNNSMANKFQATTLWNDIITHLKKNIELKPKKGKLKLKADLFAGSDAVSVVLDFLRTSPSVTKDVTRLNALKVCSSLLNVSVLESANSKELEFEDSPHRYFRFTSCDGSAVGRLLPPVTPMMKKRKRSGSGAGQSYAYVNLAAEQLPQSPSHAEVKESGVSFVPGGALPSFPVPSGSALPTGALPSPAARRLAVGSPPSICQATDSRSPPLPIGRVHTADIRQQALVRLTRLLELPLLDELLQLLRAVPEPAPLPAVRPACDQVCNLAAEVLCHVPRSGTQSCASRKELLEAVCRAADKGQLMVFSAACAPALAQCHKLLLHYKDSVALKALQLLLLLLTTRQRHLCGWLLQLNAACGDVAEVSLQKLQQSLSQALFGAALPQDARAALLCYMSNHWRPLLEPPEELLWVEAGSSDLAPERLSAAEYREQARSTTERALRDMTSQLLADPSRSEKEKQRHLAALRDNHPVVFARHFSGELRH